MRLLHYSDKPLGPLRSVEQTEPRSYFDKPRGLWVSVEGEDDWREWCLSEQFALERLTHVHEITLAPGARILRLRGERDIDDFTARYGRKVCGYAPDRPGIWWPAVAADHQGIIIAPYVWSRRFDCDWYYTWDCASGCIWDAAAVASATLVEVVPAPEPEPA